MYGSDGERVSLAAIIIRDGLNCGICGGVVDLDIRWPAPMSKSLDHIYPLSKGGPHTNLNCQLAHLRCNLSKGARVTQSVVA